MSEIVRAGKRQEPCNDPDCLYAKTGKCCFGARDLGCFMKSKLVQDLVKSTRKTCEMDIDEGDE